MKSIFSNIFRAWKFQTASQIATISVLTGTFTVLAVSLLIHQNFERLLTHWGKEVRVNVYMQDRATSSDRAGVEELIQNSDFFTKVEYLSKADAAKRFQDRVGQFLPGLLTDLEEDNPLPASFEMVVEGGLHTSTQFDLLKGLADKIKKMAGVDEVSYGQGWVENYASVLRVFSVTSAVFLIVLMAGGLFIIGNSIRNSIIQRRDEIEIMELFGAKRSEIILPYVVEGFVTGAAASFIALLATYSVFLWQSQLLSNGLSFWNIQTQLVFLNVSRMLLVVGAGGVIGGLGAYIWVRDISTGWAAADAGSVWSNS